MAWGTAPNQMTKFRSRIGAVGSSRGMELGSDLLNPLGSSAIRAALQRRAQRTARNQRQRGSVLSRLVGLDPMGQRQAMVDTERDASGTMSDFINSADENQMIGQQDFLRGNYRQQRGFEQEGEMAKLMAKLQGGGGLAALLGELLGTAGGAFLGGPPGAAAGRSLFGGGGGQTRQQAAPRSRPFYDWQY